MLTMLTAIIMITVFTVFTVFTAITVFTVITVLTLITVFPVFTASVPHSSLDGGKVYLAAEQFALSVLAESPQHHSLGRLKLRWRSREGKGEEGN